MQEKNLKKRRTMWNENQVEHLNKIFDSQSVYGVIVLSGRQVQEHIVEDLLTFWEGYSNRNYSVIQEDKAYWFM